MSAPDCHPDREHIARGLCKRCYMHAMREGTLDQYPPRGHHHKGRALRCAELAEDAAFVLECGCRCHEVGVKAVHGNGYTCPCGGIKTLAERLGVRRDTLRKALQRARARQSVAA
jgi:hypothetical protein